MLDALAKAKSRVDQDVVFIDPGGQRGVDTPTQKFAHLGDNVVIAGILLLLRREGDLSILVLGIRFHLRRG